MDIFLFIVYVVAVLGLPYFIIKYILATLDKSKYRTLAIVVSVLSCVIFFSFLISARFIPGKVSEYISYGIKITENKLNEISPGYTEQLLDKEKIKNMLQDTKQMRHNLNEYTNDVSFLTRILGVDAYLSFFEAFADNIDNNIRFFEEKGIPFNIHNILQYIKDESDVKLKDIVSVISFVLFILSMIIYALVVLYVVAIKKQWIDTDNKSIVYGDNV